MDIVIDKFAAGFRVTLSPDFEFEIHDGLRSAVIYSCAEPDAPFRNATVPDATLEADHRLEIPMRTQLRGFRRLGALRRRTFGVLRENAHRQIRLALTHQCTSVRRIRENQPRARRVPMLGCNPLRLPARARHARILHVTQEFSGALRAILVRYAPFRIYPREEARARDGTNRLSACR